MFKSIWLSIPKWQVTSSLEYLLFYVYYRSLFSDTFVFFHRCHGAALSWTEPRRQVSGSIVSCVVGYAGALFYPLSLSDSTPLGVWAKALVDYVNTINEPTGSGNG